MSMNAAEIKSTARQMTIALLMPVFEENCAVKFGDASFAIPQEVDGQFIWTSVEIKSKQYKATKVSPEFDPYKAAEKWKAEKDEMTAIKAEKKALHDAKVAKAKTK